MGLAVASSTVIFPQEVAASPGDEAAPQRPQDIVRKATKQVGMMGFLKPLTDAEKLAKQQRELEKFNADRAAKVADAEASRKTAATKRPQEACARLRSEAYATSSCNEEAKCRHSDKGCKACRLMQ
jgi:hypothetical protein